jgi:putative ABC transport system permease protein
MLPHDSAGAREPGVIVKLLLLKEVKKYPFFFLLLLITLMLGTLGLTGISVVSEQVKSKLESNARELLTSDIVVSARRDLLEDEIQKLEGIFESIPHQGYKVVDIYSMVRHEKTFQTRLVEVRSIQPGFPFYGEITLRSGTFSVDGLYISKDLAELWSIATGDMLKVGESTFTVKGVVQNDSSQGLRGFSLAPRIYLPLKNLEDSTGLLKPGATGSFARHFRIKDYQPDQFEELRKKLLNALTDNAIKVTLPQESSEQSGRVIGYLTDFMSLAALIGLILSLVGVFYLYQSHLVARLKDFCLFNLYGLEKPKLLGGLILQFTLVFFLVFTLQSFLIVPGYKLLYPILSQNLGMDLSPEVNLKSVLMQLPFLYGLVLTILVPLLMGLMRTPMGLQLKAPKLSMGRFRFFDFLPFILLLWAFAVYLSHSLKTGTLFFVGLLVVFIFSTLLIKCVQWTLKKIFLKQGKSLLNPDIETGVAIRNIVHSGHKLTLSFLSLAMGATLISLILQLDRLIQKEFTLDEKKPALFIFDIQEDQIENLTSFADRQGVKLEGVTPMIRARLEKVNGNTFTRQEDRNPLRTREEEVEARMRNRGINLTYRQNLSAGEKILEGKPFPSEADPNRPAWISLEKRFAQRMDLEIGDLVTFDVQGVEVEGRVLNLREVKWTSFYPNFFVNVEPGYIDEAPKTYLAVLPQGSRESKQNFQREAVGEFPNVSFIDVEELIAKLSNLFDKSRRAIEVISWLSLGVGLVILYGLSHDQVYRRYYDLALMKSLGFSSSSLRKHLIIEFGFVFILAMSVGFFLGWLMAIIIGREAFKLEWSIDLGRIIYPGLFLTILCLGTIFISSWKAVRSKPRELLSDS